MPISLEEFRKLDSVPAGQTGRKFQRKCDWSKVMIALGGQAWSVKEAHEIAGKFVGKDQSISRTRVKRFLDKLVEKKLAVSSFDGMGYVYYVNPPVIEVKAPIAQPKPVVAKPAIK